MRLVTDQAFVTNCVGFSVHSRSYKANKEGGEVAMHGLLPMSLSMSLSATCLQLCPNALLAVQSSVRGYCVLLIGMTFSLHLTFLVQVQEQAQVKL